MLHIFLKKYTVLYNQETLSCVNRQRLWYMVYLTIHIGHAILIVIIESSIKTVIFGMDKLKNEK